ncbi:WD repeat domain phosphoinositide-interacting protein 3 [Halteromyces radiatus]|uniref:WD repeat domain phosphoinositide-interacting protein 3 n=1 Tax=Halteromyces radiatus TaxID=101107 RepID=UPI002220F9E8|nr:WD repeat domain phosphoinositide-interacting protein 3 [Halteromyces radiatus]KAI8096582.1 WD repeat domain phosphoinositide-interacting protein 3 [Halteromyces radiatus]
MNLTHSHPNQNDAPGLLYAGFNQDYGCFAIGLDNGFRVYNSEPLIEQARHESDEGGIALVEMLYRTNYLALIGGGRNPRYPPNKVIVYDSIKGKAVLELEYKSEVKNVKLRRERLVVVLTHKVFVYHFSLHPHLLHTFETTDNRKGLAAVSASPDHAMLVIPGRQRGHVQLIDLDTLGYYWSSMSTTDDQESNGYHSSNLNHYEANITSGPSSSTTSTSQHNASTRHLPAATTANISIIAAHSGNLSCIALNHDGTKCATASDKGTLIRVFNTTTGTLLNELRRGMDRAEIFSIAFNQDSTRLCVSSDKGTIHIFNLDPSVVIMADHKPRGPTYGQVVIYPTSQSASQYGLTHSGNRGSSLSFMKDLLPKYFSSEWSFAHAKVITESQCLVAFEQKHTILAICADGSCYKFYFDPKKGGECTRESFERFYKPDSL